MKEKGKDRRVKRVREREEGRLKGRGGREMEKRGKRGGESICFLSGVQLEEEQTTKEGEEEEEWDQPENLSHTHRLAQGKNLSTSSWEQARVCVCVCV